MAEFEDISVGVADRIGTVSINRPEKGNTVRPHTLAEICVGLDTLIADDKVAAIVRRAEGKHFSAGADFAFLEQMEAMSGSEIKASVYQHFQGAARRLYHCPKPTLALVQGAAVTVGCELALACDFRVLADNAFLQESWIRLGIMPPLGGLFLLPRMIGLGRASQMVLRGIQVKAEEAERIGLASEVVALDALASRGAELAAELAAVAPLAYASVKQAMHRGLETSMEAEWSANVNNQAILLKSEDFREGLAAVKGKRAPAYRGR
ncbi:MAG: enoyl-CoA hydratase/isomerase family protein [Sphingomonadaceae bacterium]|nr:enoyl-CoA hydratase/isomerase family protein [Sphingomonadaceae bacterium]